MGDGHYNGCKDGDNQCIHAWAWDNFGFDGPKTYRDLSFDAGGGHVAGRVDVDVREPEEWQHGHIDGSVPAPRGLLEFLADPTVGEVRFECAESVAVEPRKRTRLKARMIRLAALPGPDGRRQVLAAHEAEIGACRCRRQEPATLEIEHRHQPGLTNFVQLKIKHSIDLAGSRATLGNVTPRTIDANARTSGPQ